MGLRSVRRVAVVVGRRCIRIDHDQRKLWSGEPFHLFLERENTNRRRKCTLRQTARPLDENLTTPVKPIDARSSIRRICIRWRFISLLFAAPTKASNKSLSDCLPVDRPSLLRSYIIRNREAHYFFAMWQVNLRKLSRLHCHMEK